MLPLDGADAIFAYTRDAGGDLHARMFSPLDGIVEDPATGSAAAATAALLTTLLAQDAVTERSWRIHQGVDMGRPSVLMARTTRRNGVLETVHIGGRCVAVMEGTFDA
jgi:trans-2,3-dihydro-3-hydroxyanthranilate isomerase